MNGSNEREFNNVFLLKEYECLRAEMNEAVKETRLLERNAAIATATIWSWLATHQGCYFLLAILLPGVLVILSIIRVFGLIRHIKAIENYLKEIENIALNKDIQEHVKFGFERHHKQDNSIKRKFVILFWVVLSLLTILIPLFFY